MTILDNKSIKMLMVIQDQPLITLSELAKTIKMSVSGTAERLKRITSELKVITTVSPNLNKHKLDLKFYDFFYQVQSSNALKTIEEKFCYNHPYVSYRGRCYGKYSGIYIQYRAPTNSYKYLDLISRKLVDLGLAKDYTYIKRDNVEKPVNVNSAIKSYDSETNTWTFNWEKWSEEFYNASEESQAIDQTSEKIIDKLSLLDIKLLAELTLDARKKNVEMIRNLKLQDQPGIAQKVSRRVSFLKDQAISGYRVFLNWTSFDLYQTIVIRGFCSKSLAKKLRNYLYYSNGTKGDSDKPTFPFVGVFVITETGFLWYVRAPPSHIADLTNFVMDICPKHDIFMISFKYSRTYGLWDETFNEETNYWRKSREFMVDSIIEKLH